MKRKNRSDYQRRVRFVFFEQHPLAIRCGLHELDLMADVVRAATARRGMVVRN